MMRETSMPPRVVLYGATGHTGRFIAAEMESRGWASVLAGRDPAKLKLVASGHGAEAIVAKVTDRAALDRLLASADAVINAAGPFADTSPYLIEAAVRAGIPYFDVTAEPFVARDLFDTYDEAARRAGTIVAPACAFFGALGDLLVSAAATGWDAIDSIDLAFALDRWRPTVGTRLAGARRAGRRLILADRQFMVRDPSESVPRGTWQFAQPFGEQPMIGEFSTVDVVTVGQHIPVGRMATWINEAPIADLTAADPSGPEAADDSGRSAQQFRIEAVVRRGSEERRAALSGRDIYAITAPIVCEAVAWALAGRARATGARSAGELLDATAFLAALSPDPLTVTLPELVA